MKKIYPLLAAAILCTMNIEAHTLSPQEAETAVTRFLHSPTMRARALDAAGPMHLTKTIETSRGEAALYLFAHADGRGMVVASAESETPSVLGYTLSEFDANEINPELAYMLSSYAAEIEAVRQGREMTRPVLRRTPLRSQQNWTPVAPICQTKWNQNAPYNRMCPTLNGKATATGCVATAVSQAMKVFNYPECGTGTVTYDWQVGNQQLTRDLEANPLEWDSMLTDYNTGYTNQEADAVANLMVNVGYGVNMNYNLASKGGSGASGYSIPKALINNFNYDKGAYMAERQHYYLDVWQGMVYDEIAAGRPVVYLGQSMEGGHCFVADGYDADGMFHINWGWGGLSDGYFRLTALNPESQGIGGSASGYNFDQGAIIGMQLPKEGSEYHYQAYMLNNLEISPQQGGMNDTYSVAGGLINSSPVTLNGNLGVKITNAQGENFYAKGAKVTGGISPAHGVSKYNIAGVLMPDAEGVYTVRPAFYCTDTNQWIDVQSTLGSVREYTMTVTADGRSFQPVEDAANIELTDVNVPSAIQSGKPFTLTAKLVNNGDTDYEAYLSGALIVDEFSQEGIVDEGNNALVNVGAGQTVEFTYTAELQAEEGQYQFCMVTIGGVALMNPTPMTVLGAGQTSKAEVSSLHFTSGTAAGDGIQDVDASDIRIAGTVACTQGVFTGTISGYVAAADGGSVLGSIGSQAFGLTASQSADLEINGAFPGGAVGQTYMLALFCDGKQMDCPALTFRITKNNAVDEVYGTRPALRVNGDMLTVENAPAYVSVTVYALDGRPVLTSTTGAAELSGLTPGVYIAVAQTEHASLRLRFIR